jgi:hypothetical protein
MSETHDWIISVGEDSTRIVQLKVDGKAYDATGATVTAQIKDKLKASTTANGAIVACTDAGNADFSAGIIEVIYADTVTTALTAGTFQLEVLVVEAGGDKKIFRTTDDVQIYDTVQG